MRAHGNAVVFWPVRVARKMQLGYPSPYQAALWDRRIAASKAIAVEVKSMIFDNCNN